MKGEISGIGMPLAIGDGKIICHICGVSWTAEHSKVQHYYHTSCLRCGEDIVSVVKTEICATCWSETEREATRLKIGRKENRGKRFIYEGSKH